MIPEEIKNRFFIDHIALTITDVSRTETFYSAMFGPPEYKNESSLMYYIGPTKLFLVSPGKITGGDKFNPDIIGLNHFAVNVSNVEQLEEIAKHLTSASITHSGVHIDKHSNKEKIWLNDPDNIRVEFFIRP
jgi:glyoxylase I family protein